MIWRKAMRMTGGCRSLPHERAVILSANELTALAAKAARGAGAPPQQAAAFGSAALCHFQAGRAPQHLRAALEALPAGPIIAVPVALIRVIEAVKDTVAEGVLRVDCPGDLLHSYLEAQPFDVSITPTPDGIMVTCKLDTPAHRKQASRVTLPGGLAQQMTTLAANLLVPDTAASRESGAGAGLTDND